MCIIVHKPANVELSRETFAECFRCNKDGAGIAYVDDAANSLVVKKGFFKFEDLEPLLDEHKSKELLVHFRIATAGGVNEDNCHPFFFQSVTNPQFQFALVHNGVMQWRTAPDKSDTHCFALDLLWPLLDRDPWFLQSPMRCEMMARTIGVGNKIAIMRYDTTEKRLDTWVINRKAGVEDLGCWFSNSSYKVWAPRAYSCDYGYGVRTQSLVGFERMDDEDRAEMIAWYQLVRYSKAKRKRLAKIAKDAGIVDTSETGALIQLRALSREFIPSVAPMNDPELDEWLVKQVAVQTWFATDVQAEPSTEGAT